MLAGGLFRFEDDGTRATGGTAKAIAYRPDIKLEFGDGPTECVAVHPQSPSRFALIAVVFLQHGYDEPFFELSHGFGVQNSTLVHLGNQAFKLILHGASLCQKTCK